MKKLFLALAIGAFAACGEAGETETTTPAEGTMQENTMPSTPADSSMQSADSTAVSTDTTAAQ